MIIFALISFGITYYVIFLFLVDHMAIVHLVNKP
jgi:hypothetical protein